MKYVTPLSDPEIETLQQMQAHHSSRRARMRAHSLLLSHQGIAMPQIARIYQVDSRRALSQNCLFEAKSENRVLENQ